MAENTTPHNKFEEHIPEEPRQHFRAAREEMRKGLETFFPQGFVEHRRNARREMLLAWRSLLDKAIQRMDDKE